MNYKEVAALNKAQWTKAPRPMQPVPQYIRDISREEWTELFLLGKERQKEQDRLSDEWQDRFVERNTRSFFWGVLF